jgi:hypothetical protein
MGQREGDESEKKPHAKAAKVAKERIFKNGQNILCSPTFAAFATLA